MNYLKEKKIKIEHSETTSKRVRKQLKNLL